jgi:uncharacterized membrane protein
MLRRNLLIILPVAVAVIFSLLAIWFYGVDKTEFGDAEDYINGANAFLNGTPYPLRSVFHPMFRPPLFPLLIAGVWSIFPDSIVAIKFTQCLLHALTVFFAYKTVYELLRKEVPAVLGALVVAINPLLAGHTVDFYTEPLHTFLCILAMFLLAKLLKSDTVSYIGALSVGVVFGLATLCRPAILGVAVSVIAVFAWVQIREIDRAKYVGAALIMFFGMGLTIAPWTYHNYVRTGEFVLVNDGFSYNLWLGNLPGTLRLYQGEFASKEENQAFADHYWGTAQYEKLAELEQTDNFSTLGINEREKVWRREALANMSADYGLTARLMIGKVGSFWTPFLNRWAYGNTVVNLIAFFVISTYIFGLYGMYVLFKEKAGQRYVLLLIVTFAVTTVIHVVIFGFVRYRVPNVDPYVSMLTGVAVWHIAARFLPRLDA